MCLKRTTSAEQRWDDTDVPEPPAAEDVQVNSPWAGCEKQAQPFAGFGQSFQNILQVCVDVSHQLFCMLSSLSWEV